MHCGAFVLVVVGVHGGDSVSVVSNELSSLLLNTAILASSHVGRAVLYAICFKVVIVASEELTVYFLYFRKQRASTVVPWWMM